MNRQMYEQQRHLRENSDKRNSATPRFDKLTPQQKADLADRSVPLPKDRNGRPLITNDELLREAGRLFYAQYCEKFGTW